MDRLLAKALEPEGSHLLGHQAVPTSTVLTHSHFWPRACPRRTVQKTATASHWLGKAGSFCCLATLKGGIPLRHSNPGLLVLWHCDNEFFFFFSLSFLLCKTGDNSYLGFWKQVLNLPCIFCIQKNSDSMWHPALLLCNHPGKLFKTPCASISPLAMWGIIKCKLSLTVLGGLKELIWGVLRMVWHIVNVFGFSLLHPL